MRRTKAAAAITRETVLKAALAVFSQKGFAAATLEDIASQAGVTRGAVYWHFENKAEMYTTLLGEYAARSSDIVRQAAAEGGDLPDVLARILIRLLTAAEADPDLRALLAISQYKTDRTDDLHASQQKQIEHLRSLLGTLTWTIRKGIAAGDLRDDLDPVEIARALLAFQNGIVSLWLQDPAAFSLKNSAPALVKIFLNGILPAAG